MARWYHRAALVIWPKQRRFFNLSQAGQSNTIPRLKLMVQSWVDVGESQDNPQWQQCRTFASEIIKQWRTPPPFREDRSTDANTMLELLAIIGDIALIKQFMKTVLTQKIGGDEGKAIAVICGKFGWTPFQDELCLLAEQKDAKNIAEYVQLFEHFCCLKNQSSPDRLSVCKALSKNIVVAVINQDRIKQPSWIRDSPVQKSNMVASLFKGLYTIGALQLLDNTIQHFFDDKIHYGTHSVLIPALKNLYPWVAKEANERRPFNQLLERCISELKACTSAPIIEPTNWVQNIKFSCTCIYCGELEIFLRDPDQQVHRFRVRKDRRQHLHQQISQHDCDLTHATERKGSPQTLVCTKTRASYENKKKQRQIDLEFLADLQSMMPS